MAANENRFAQNTQEPTLCPATSPASQKKTLPQPPSHWTGRRVENLLSK